MLLPRKPIPGQAVTADLLGEMIDYMQSITPRAGLNVRVSRSKGGAMIDAGQAVTAKKPVRIAPWTVRKHKPQQEGGSAQWEIYLPSGCMIYGEKALPINLYALGAGGHREDAQDWYRISLNEKDGNPTRIRKVTERDESGNLVTRYASVWDWDIVVHVKPQSKIYAVDRMGDPGRCLMYVAAKKAYQPLQTPIIDDAERVKDAWGDAFEAVVAQVTIWDNNTVTITQIEGNNIHMNDDTRHLPNFRLEWWFGVAATTGELSVKDLHCVDPLLSAAGFDLTGPSRTTIPLDAKSVYAKVSTNPLVVSTGISNSVVTVVTDPSDDTSDNDITWLKLYDLCSAAVEKDWRSVSLVNVQVYR